MLYQTGINEGKYQCFTAARRPLRVVGQNVRRPFGDDRILFSRRLPPRAPDRLNGISHFIEHTVFKGSAKRSALDIAIEQDRLGGDLDAFTTHEETGFAIKVIDDQLPQAFDLIADMLANTHGLDEKDLESEPRVIIEEMKML